MGSRAGVVKRSSKKNVFSKAKETSFRVALEEKRVAFVDLYRHDLKVGQSASDEGTEDLVDIANKAYDRELMLRLSDTERTMIFEVDEALTRLEAGTFGRCENCSDEIGEQRLNAVPWARYCIRCQERKELGLLD